MELLTQINNLVWGPPLLALLVGTGIWLTLRLGFLQIIRLPLAFKLIFSAKNEGHGDVSSFAALCTALAATIGTGNIVGVGTAIKIGGPGALFWMWMAAFFGMATKYAEGCLAVKYRKLDDNGQVSGGPMYYIINGLGSSYKPLAVLFASFAILASLFGIGTFPQVNAIIESCESFFGISTYITCAIVTALVALVTIGGIKKIAAVSSKIVPFMALFYFLVCLAILLLNFHELPAAVWLVIESAFSPVAAVGGFTGATMMIAMQFGIARGVFSNEAGLGSAPIAAAAAKTNSPAEQGLISMTGTFIDTIIICTMTGLAIIITNAWTTDLNGASMTQFAFSTAMPHIGSLLVTISLILFAFTSILGWNYYGERCAEYLFGVRGILPYRLLFILLIASSAFLKLEFIWLLADTVNGLMAIPNLIALLLLTPVIVEETKKYLSNQPDEVTSKIVALQTIPIDIEKENEKTL